MADEDIVFQMLMQDSAFTALCDDRLYPNTAPEGTVTPYAVYFLVDAIPEAYLAERSGPDNRRVQIDYYDTTRSGAKALKNAARNALDLHFTLLNEIEYPFTQDLGTTQRMDGGLPFYRFSQDWSLWLQP